MTDLSWGRREKDILSCIPGFWSGHGVGDGVIGSGEGCWAPMPSPEVGRKLFSHLEFACVRKLMLGKISTFAQPRQNETKQKLFVFVILTGMATNFTFLEVVSH